MSIENTYFFILTKNTIDNQRKLCYHSKKTGNELNLKANPIQRAFVWWEKVRIFRELHSGVAVLNRVGADGYARYSLMRLVYFMPIN